MTDITRHGLAHKLRHVSGCTASGWPEFNSDTDCTCGLFDSLAKFREFFVIRLRASVGDAPRPVATEETLQKPEE